MVSILKQIHFIIIVLLSILFPLTFAFYTIPTQIALGAASYPSPNETGPNAWEYLYGRLLFARLTYGVIALILAILLISVLRVYPLADPIRKENLKYLLGYYAYGFVASVMLVIAITVFLILKKSFDSSVWWGTLYPILIAGSQYLAGIASFFLVIFSKYTYRREYPTKYAMIQVVLLLIYGLIASLPYNFYGMDAPANTLHLRFLSNSMLLIVYISALYPSVDLFKLARIEQSYSRKVRLYLLLYGNISMVFFFVGYAMDGISKIHYSPWLIIALFFLVLTAILYYFAVSPPEWFLRKLKARETKRTATSSS